MWLLCVYFFLFTNILQFIDKSFHPSIKIITIRNLKCRLIFWFELQNCYQINCCDTNNTKYFQRYCSYGNRKLNQTIVALSLSIRKFWQILLFVNIDFDLFGMLKTILRKYVCIIFIDFQFKMMMYFSFTDGWLVFGIHPNYCLLFVHHFIDVAAVAVAIADIVDTWPFFFTHVCVVVCVCIHYSVHGLVCVCLQSSDMILYSPDSNDSS